MSDLVWAAAGLGLGLALGATLLWLAERRARAAALAACEVQLAWLHAALRDLSRAHEALRDLTARAEADLTAGGKRPTPEQASHAAAKLHQAAREAEVALERTRELRRALQASQRSLFGRAQLLSPERGLLPAEDLGLPGLLEPPPAEPLAAPEHEPPRAKLAL